MYERGTGAIALGPRLRGNDDWGAGLQTAVRAVAARFVAGALAATE